MRFRSANRQTQIAAENRLERDAWMDWRIRRFGFACLTVREYEAMSLEMWAMRPHEGGRQQITAVENYIAAAMHITQPRVSKLLYSAERAMKYFAEHEMDVAWEWLDGAWRLDAPVSAPLGNFQGPSVINIHPRVMMVRECA